MRIPQANKPSGSGSNDPRKQAAKSMAKSYIKKAVIGFIVSNIGVILAVIVIAAAAGAMLGTVMTAWSAATGVFSHADKAYMQQQLGQDYQNGNSLQDLLTQYLSCEHASKIDQKDHFCVDVTNFAESSPIPEDKQWLVPIWQAAGAKYNVQWELLAAVAAARTNFGDADCADVGHQLGGIGFYRMDPAVWAKYKEDAGATILTPTDPPNQISIKVKCYTPQLPLKGTWTTKDGQANPYDPVDSTFALAHYLADSNPNGISSWDYSGSEAGTCVTPDRDGISFSYVPEAGAIGGDAGWNSDVHLSQEALAIGQLHTVAEWAGGNYPGPPGARGEIQYPDYKHLNAAYVPVKQERLLIEAAGRAIGMPEDLIAQVEPGLIKQISRESGGWSNAVQSGALNDGNQAFENRARGMFQFTPSTWNAERIPGYNNIFNPAHNALAAISAMRWSTGPVASKGNLDLGSDGNWTTGLSGWGPDPWGANPYANTIGRYNGGSGTKAEKSGKYLGAKIDDAVSELLMQLGYGPNASSCMIATIHDWYQAIVDNPPTNSFVVAAGGKLASFVATAVAQKGVTEQPVGTNRGPMVDIFERAVGTVGQPWCAAFVSWAAQQAGIPLLDNGMGSASVESFYQWANEPAVNLWEPRASVSKPQPGDLVLFSSRYDGTYAHIGIVVNSGPPFSPTFYTVEGNSDNAVEINPRSTVPNNEFWVYGYIALSKLYGQVPGSPTPGDPFGSNPLADLTPTPPVGSPSIH